MSKTGKIAMPTQGWLYVLTGLVVALFLTLAPFAAQAQSLFTGGGSSDTETTETTPEAEAKAPLDTLLEVLKDDDARAALIADLEKSLDASGDPAGDENPAIETITEAADAEGVSVGRQIALITQQIGQDTVSTLTSFWNGFERGGKVFSGLSGAELTVLLEAIPGLLAVIAITVALFVVLRYLARGLYARMGRTAEHVGLFRSIGLFLGSNLLDAFIVVVAWAAGYLITILAVGEVGQIGIRQSMYLNAFLLVEMTKVVIRSFLSPVASGLRLVPVGDKAAAALTRYLSIVVSVLGYGQLLVVPIVNQSVNTAAGAGVSALLSVLVLLYFVYIVLRRRKAVTRWLQSEADPSEAGGDHLNDK